jgi:hypothetical protein
MKPEHELQYNALLAAWCMHSVTNGTDEERARGMTMAAEHIETFREIAEEIDE